MVKALIGLRTPTGALFGYPEADHELDMLARSLLRALWWREKLRMWLPYAGRGREQSVVWEAPEMKS